MIICILNELNLPCNMRIGCLSTCFNYLPQQLVLPIGIDVAAFHEHILGHMVPAMRQIQDLVLGWVSPHPDLQCRLVHGDSQGARTWMNRFEGSCRSGWKSCLSVRLRLGLVEVALELGKPHGSHAQPCNERYMGGG